MCLTVPRRVEQVKDDKALMQDGRWVSLVIVGEVKKGDFLLVQANLAVERVTSKQVMGMKKAMEE